MKKLLIAFTLFFIQITFGQTPEIVDEPGDVGKYSSLSFNTSGNPVITYYDGTNSSLKVAEYNGSSWNLSTIDNQYDVGSFSSLAITSNGNVNISYYDATHGALKYQGWIDFTWTWSSQNVYQVGNVGQYNSIDFDNSNQPVISHYDQTNTQLILSHFDNNTSQWQNLSFDNEGDVGQYSSIAIVPNGDYNISYYDASSGALKYQGWIDFNWNWQPEMVYQLGNVGQYNSIDFDADDQPVISHYDQTNTQLILSHFDNNTSQWQNLSFDNEGDVGQYSSIAIVPNGDYNISYYDASSGALKYQGWIDFNWNWQPEMVYQLGNVGQYNSIDFDADDQPVISHYDQTNTQLVLSHFDNNTSQWQNLSFDNEGDVGQYSSIAIVPNGDYNISYYDVDRGALKYQGWIDYSWQWQPEIISSANNVGMYNSIAFSPGNVPFVSYYNGTTGDLMLGEMDINTQEWSETPIDQSGDVGQYSSIDIDQYGNAGISYYALTNQDLKFADNIVWQNNPPFVSDPMDDLYLDEDFGTIQLDDLDDVFDDPDQQQLSFQVSVSNPNLFVNINSGTNIPSFWTSDNWYGNGQIIFSATDGFPESIVYDTVDVVVESVNDEPVISDLENTSFYEDNTLVLNLNNYVTDVDHDTTELNWQVTKLNSDSINFQLEQSANKITFSTPLNYTCSNTPFSFIVTDPENGRDSTTIEISVIEVNDPPQWQSVSDTSFNEDDSLFIALNFFRDLVYDPDDSSSNFIFNFLGKNISTSVKNDTLKLIASANWSGLDTLLVKVTDHPGGMVDSTNWDVSVKNINDPPQIINLLDFSFINHSSKEMNLAEKVTDADDSKESLVWQIVPENDSLIVDIQNQTAVFSAENDFTELVKTKFIVSDPEGLKDSSNIIIQVMTENYASGIYLIKSSDSGKTWNNLKSIPYTHIFHHAHLTEIDNKMYIYGVTYNQDSVLYMISEDQGQSWNPPILYVDNLDAYYTSVWLDESGIYVLSTKSQKDSIQLLLPDDFLVPGQCIENISYAKRNTSNDILRSPQGKIYITFQHSSYYNRFMLSDDNGQNWKTINISESALYYPKYSLIDDELISVSNYYGSSPPYDSYIKYTQDDGLNWTEDWIDISNTSGVTLDRFGQIVRIPDNQYMAMWSCDNTEQIEFRFSDNIEQWTDTVHDTLINTSKPDFDLTRIKEDIYVLFFDMTQVTHIGNESVLPLPEQYQLSQNYPNPFNPLTTIRYALPTTSKVTVEIYNILGQKVTILENTKKQPGYYTVEWNALNFASGIYFVKIKCQRHGEGIVFIDFKKMILLK